MSAKKNSKGQASITSNGEHLRISLPRNLFEGKQKYISLNLKDTLDNRAKAQLKLKVVQRDIDYEEFDYTLVKYSSNPAKVLAAKKNTIKDLINGYREKYFFTISENKRQHITTFENHFNCLNRVFVNYYNLPLSEEIITKVIASTKAGSSTRRELVKVLSVFCNHFEFKYSFKGLAKGYKPKDRNLPEDESIECACKLIQENEYQAESYMKRAESWGWVIMVLATYGLRPHELLAISYEKSFKLPHYVLEIDGTITDGTKTGDRKVYPIPKAWVEKYNLCNVKNKVLLDYKGKIEDFSVAITNRIKQRKKFQKTQDLVECLSFQPYDLRHRYAVRGHELGYQVEAMARWMGHSVTMHVKTYHKYLKDDTDRKVFEAALHRAQELERFNNDLPSYEELEAELKLAIEKIRLLEEENTILKQSSS